MNQLKSILWYLVILLSLLATIASLLSLIYDVQFWVMKVLDFPRLQLLLASLLLLLLLVILQKGWSVLAGGVALGLVVSFAIQAYFIFPYTTFADEEVKGLQEKGEEHSTVNIILANVYMHNRNDEGLLNIIEEVNPDMILLMEVSGWWANSLQPLSSQYPYSVHYPLENTYGMILLSRIPLVDPEIKFLNHDDVPSVHTKVRLGNGKMFNFHGVHPVPPIPDEYPDNTGEKEVALLKVGKMVSEEEGPAMVAGDFNDVSWSNTARMFGERGKLGNVRLGRGLYNTFDATSPILRWPLDHVFVTEEFAVVKIERLRSFDSDHFPLYVELAL